MFPTTWARSLGLGRSISSLPKCSCRDGGNKECPPLSLGSRWLLLSVLDHRRLAYLWGTERGTGLVASLQACKLAKTQGNEGPCQQG